jgi:dTDP-4-amino-4,6-dideoxygalactose transaminase
VRHEERDRVMQDLAGLGIDTLIHYPIPPHQSEAYANDREWGHLPIAVEFASTMVSLPMGPHLTAADATRVLCDLEELSI